MRHRTLPLALLIAVSVVPVAGCSDNDDSANNPSADKNLTAEQTTDASGDESHSGSPIPVNNPNKHGDSQPSTASKTAPAAPDRIKQLARQIASIKQTDQKRLDQQAQRIDKIEHQVAALTKRLHRLPQPTASKSGSSDQHAKARKKLAPDTVSPQSDDAGPEDASESNTNNAANSGSDDELTDESDTSDAGSASSDSSPASGKVTGPNIVTHCLTHGDTVDQFDVFYQATTGNAMNAAANKVKAAGLSDWFARTSIQRVYVGRYGNCPLAERRRDDVHQRTGLVLNIKAVQPHHTSAPKRTNHRHAHDYSASDKATATIRRATTQPIQPVVTNAPFAIVGVEIRGTHHYLGAASHGTSRLGGVTWLSPGDSYGTWTLRAIRTDVGIASFAHGGRTVALALPRRG